MAIRHGNKTYLQILLDPHRAELLRELAENRGLRPTAWIRDACYATLKKECDVSTYNAAQAKDEATWRESVRKRVEGRRKNRKEAEDAPGDADTTANA